MGDYKGIANVLCGGIAPTYGQEPVRQTERQGFASKAERENFIKTYFPPRIARALDHTRWTVAQKAIMDKILDEHRSMVIIGRNGTGKTLLMNQCELEMYARDDNPLFMKASDFFDKLRSIVKENGDVGKYVTELASGKSCIFIDEIDKANGTQFEFLQFYELIDQRYENMLQTVVAGNFKSWEECAFKMGQSALDRLSNSEDGFMAELNQESFRGIHDIDPNAVRKFDEAKK